MSDPVSCPKSAPCSKAAPCPRYARLLLVMLVFWVINLVLIIAALASVIAQHREGAPKPAPSTTAPAEPSAPPTKTPPPGPAPSEPTPSEPAPSGSPCSIFDPECSPTGGDPSESTEG
ncbi:hypothetical protein [Streptomyces hirsutus]|uniref:hypothetical protein n=1 Tax=Streptomyces hirsutus TaxID=35620 RepID=UPI0033349FF7